jgi:putative ATPase
MLTYVSKNDIVLKERIIHFSELEALYSLSGGDARKALNLLELAVLQTAGTVELTDVRIIDIAQKNVAVYDKGGEMHYDIISAFIKSIRGSDPQAALYWLARMIEGGEQPDFIARRMLILASEDIGNANPNALLLAETCYRSVEKIGMPESRIILSQVVIYLACSVKSNTAYSAIEAALQTVRTTQPFPVPLHLRNAPTGLMKTLGYGKAYKYSHQFEGKEGNQDFLPPELKGTVFYHPSDKGREIEFKVFLKNQWGETYKV